MNVGSTGLPVQERARGSPFTGSLMLERIAIHASNSAPSLPQPTSYSRRTRNFRAKEENTRIDMRTISRTIDNQLLAI